MIQNKIDIVAINESKKFALLSDDSVVPITNMYDVFGAETHNNAFSFVCGKGKVWFAGKISDFVKVRSN